jgi:hypothetical protein
MGLTIESQDIHSLLVLTESDRSTHQYNEQVSYIIAGNNRTSPNILDKFSRDIRARIRIRVAENPATPLAILKKLAEDAHPGVRVGVSENKNTPGWLLNQLASDEDLDVLFDMAENPHLPESVLSKLSEHGNPYVSCKARSTLRMTAFAEIVRTRNLHEADRLLDLEKRMFSSTRIVSKGGAILRISHACKCSA